MCESYIFQINIFEFRALPFQRNVVEGFHARNVNTFDLFQIMYQITFYKSS